MNGSDRVRKFEEFKKLHLGGQLHSTEIISKLGISKNTFYNWRSRLRSEGTSNKAAHVQDETALPFFTKIIPQTNTAQPSVTRFIEIIVGAAMVIRLPESIRPESLQQVFDNVARWNGY